MTDWDDESKNATRYRVNYGNGQVHYVDHTRKASDSRKSCLSFIARYGDNHTFLEFQDGETKDWFTSQYRRAS